MHELYMLMYVGNIQTHIQVSMPHVIMHKNCKEESQDILMRVFFESALLFI